MNDMSEVQAWEDSLRAQDYNNPSALPYAVSRILRPQLTQMVLPEVLGGLKQRRRALDAGCGDAWYARWLAHNGKFEKVIAMDSSEQMLNQGEKDPSVKEIEKDVTTYRVLLNNSCCPTEYGTQDIEDDRIDFILANMLIPNFAPGQLEAFLEQCRENLTSGGKLLITNVADESFRHDSPWLRHKFESEMNIHGGEIMVSLGRDGAPPIGPFPNYLWGSNEVNELAEAAGLKRETSYLLGAEANDNTPLYQASVFRLA
jgi:SAM-dependent methyltransferase